MTEEVNPYAPVAEVEAAGLPEDDPRAIRQRHLAHEASVKSVGMLYYFVGVIALLAVVGSGWEALSAPAAISRAEPLAAAIIASGIAIAFVWTGYGLRRLRPTSRVASIVLSIIGLIYVPCGTLVGVYVLWLMLSGEGRAVFSDEYREIVAKTQVMRYRPWLFGWSALVFIIIVAAIALALLLPWIDF